MPAGVRRARSSGREIAITLALVAAACGIAWQAAGALAVPVSQRGRAFQPGTLSVQRGDTVEIINGDGELPHHAYVESPGFSFDGGEQAPGSRTDIRFTVRGSFLVLCRIHPKMKLAVAVR